MKLEPFVNFSSALNEMTDAFKTLEKPANNEDDQQDGEYPLLYWLVGEVGIITVLVL